MRWSQARGALLGGSVGWLVGPDVLGEDVEEGEGEGNGGEHDEGALPEQAFPEAAAPPSPPMAVRFGGCFGLSPSRRVHPLNLDSAPSWGHENRWRGSYRVAARRL